MAPPVNDAQLLIRLDERTKNIAEDMVDLKKSMAAEMADLKANYVHKTEFAPVKGIVFTAVGLVLVAFMITLVYLAGWKQ